MKRKPLSDEIYSFEKPDGSTAADRWTSEDWQMGWQIGRIRLGVIGLYYTDGIRRKLIPYDMMDNLYFRTRPQTTASANAYELTVCFDGDSLARLEFETESQMNIVLDKLKEKNPNITIGYRG